MFYCIYFYIIGAFAGWILECVFKAINKKFVRAPGILYGPFCILYGIGTVLLATIIPEITSNVWLQFLLSAIILTFCEYVTYVLLKKMYGLVLWSYSDMRLAISDKICVEFAVVWGVLGVLFIQFLLPILRGVYFAVSSNIFNNILLILFVCVSLDLLYTNDKLVHACQKLDK